MDDPLYKRLRTHAAQKLPDGLALGTAEAAEAVASYYSNEMELNFRNHRNKVDSGERVAEANAFIMDVLLERLFALAIENYASQHGVPPCHAALLAVGGYGRTELAPKSDIDITLIVSENCDGTRADEFKVHMTRNLTDPLFAQRLKVGMSTRTIKESLSQARQDDETKTALLEARPIAGSEPLWEQFHTAYRNYYLKEDQHAYIENRLRDQENRRRKYENTVYLIEPDIKSGVGGLRDYQSLLWMSAVKYDIKTLEGLEEHGYLQPRDAQHLRRAHEFLTRTRNELHYISRYVTNKLEAHVQHTVAHGLGYKGDPMDRIEAFMRDYYTHARNIYHICRVLEQSFAAQKSATGGTGSALGFLNRKKTVTVDAFKIANNVLVSTHDDLFRERPERLVEVFLVALANTAKIGFRLETLIRNEAHRMTPPIAGSESVVETMMSLLRHSGKVYPMLAQMHDMGILERVVPGFARLTGLVQHQHQQRYTADIRTLRAVEVLDSSFLEKDDRGQYSALLKSVAKPELLYLILLLRNLDLGLEKERGRLRRRSFRQKALERFPLSEQEEAFATLCLRNHEEMAHFWQRYDLTDLITAKAFAHLVKNEEVLTALYIITYCDLIGTSRELWSANKQALHQSLFIKTRDFLRQGAEATAQGNGRLSMDSLPSRIPGVPAEDVEEHIEVLPPSYFEEYQFEEIGLHIDLVRQLNDDSKGGYRGERPFVIHWETGADADATKVTIVTRDRAGLFYKLAGAFSVAGINIISTRAVSRTDHITIDTFLVNKAGGGAVDDPALREQMEEALRSALVDDKDLLADILKRRKPKSSLLFATPEAPKRAPKLSIRCEALLDQLLVEIETEDRLGLLYEIAKTIYEHGFDITFARISTVKKVVVDTFYLESIEPGRTESQQNFESLSRGLNSVLFDSEETTKA